MIQVCEKLVKLFVDSGFVSLPTALLFAEHFTYKCIPKNEFHLKAGVICDEYLFIETGFMRSYVHDLDNNEVTTQFYAPNQLVFEVSSFFTRVPSKENFVAIEDCDTWYLSYAKLNQLFHQYPEFRDFGRNYLVKGFSAFKNRSLSMITQTGEERYHTLISNDPGLFQHAPLKYIASYLGVTDSSLSRIRKEYSKKSK